MKIYRVGGAVRDRLLNYPSDENDWVVVGTTPEKMVELNYVPVGSDFPVFIHPQTGEEFALARTERKSGHGYQGFTFHAEQDVSLKQDLIRRGRNSAGRGPRRADAAIYGKATGFETMVGWLFLNNPARLADLFDHLENAGATSPTSPPNP